MKPASMSNPDLYLNLIHPENLENIDVIWMHDRSSHLQSLREEKNYLYRMC